MTKLDITMIWKTLNMNYMTSTVPRDSNRTHTPSQHNLNPAVGDQLLLGAHGLANAGRFGDLVLTQNFFRTLSRAGSSTPCLSFPSQ